MPRLFRLLVVLALASGAGASASAQDVDVTFRFLPDLTAPEISPVVRAFAPGSFNGWGPNNAGAIQTGAPSQMEYEADLNEYRYTIALAPEAGPVAGGYAYKIHYHRNGSGSEWTWITDPLGTEVTGNNNDSVVRVSDPMAFQLAREQDAGGQIIAVSAGLFGSEAFTSVTFTVNEDTYTAGIEDTGDGIYRLTLPAPVSPGSLFRVDATDASGDTVSESVGTLPPDVVDAPVPAGIEDGITHTADGTYLVLRAPAKSYVYALGSFNGWTETPEGLMFRDNTDPRGTRWWVRVDGLASGEDYRFIYLIDGTLQVADPYASLVYYPGEARHPGGDILFPVAEFRVGGRDFDWTDDGFVAPEAKDLVIYELLVRDFLRDHSFESLTDTLDYLERLGVNAIELMPVSEFDGDESWGYNPAFHLALDKYYGTPEAFKGFVNEAHARGIAVILDVVYNHATGQSPLVRLYNAGGFSGPTAASPYANVSARHPFNVFNDLNHESALTQIWLDKANDWWAEEYHIDGYRYDLSKGFTQRQSSNVGQWNQYDQSRVDLLTRMADALWAEHPETYVILEHLGDLPEEQALTRYRRDEGKGMLVWRKMNREYNQGSMGYPTATNFPSTLTGTDPRNVGLPLAGAVTYMESHDEQWMMYRNLRYGNQAPGHDIRQLHTALERQKLAGAFFFTVPGPRMMWQFGEVGYGGGPGECLYENGTQGECAAGTPDRVADKPIRWDYWAEGVQPFGGAFSGTLTPATDRERELRQRLYGTWAALIALRNGYDVFTSPDTDVDLDVGRTFVRSIDLTLDNVASGEPSRALVFGNFGVTENTYTFTLSAPMTWYDYFADTEASFQAGTHTVALLPGEFRVWTDVDVPSPEGGLISVSNEGTGPLAPEALGVRAFPNPAAQAFTAEVDVVTPGRLTVELFDVLGRRVATLHEGAASVGRQRLSLDARAVPAGVYVLRAVASGEAVTTRVTIAR